MKIQPVFERRRRPLHSGCPLCTIIPSHMLRELARRDPALRDLALTALQHSERFRGHREVLAALGAVMLANPPGERRRTVYDCSHGVSLPGKLIRAEGRPKSKDVAVNEAYDYSGDVYDFYEAVFQRNSVDNRGARLDSSVHYSRRYDNAFWNGVQMVYGDGDGLLFSRFTRCLDVVGHELTHGVTQYEAGLDYHGQSGALNESFSDVFGSLVKQWRLKQTAAQADWLIGAGLFTPTVHGAALRSMKAPGTAYDDPRLGKDPQPATMKDYRKLADDEGGDYGGVHINSGIPNRAFYLVATQLGGRAWERAGRIWYDTLCNRMAAKATFVDAANATLKSAADLFGRNSAEQKAVRFGWKNVGVLN
jgi:Zn-dependent metalloprotease